MMGNLQCCHAAAWCFALLPVGRGWPTGTSQQLLSQRLACQDLWGYGCRSLPLSHSASGPPAGQKWWIHQPSKEIFAWISWLEENGSLCYAAGKQKKTYICSGPSILAMASLDTDQIVVKSACVIVLQQSHLPLIKKHFSPLVLNCNLNRNIAVVLSGENSQ